MKNFTKIACLILTCFYANVNAQRLTITNVQDRFLCQNRAVIVYFETDLELNSETYPVIIMTAESGTTLGLKAVVNQNALSAILPESIDPGFYKIEIAFSNPEVKSEAFRESLEVLNPKYIPEVFMASKSIVIGQTDKIALNFSVTANQYPLDLILNADANTVVHIPQFENNFEQIFIPQNTTFYQIQTVYIGACEYKQPEKTGIAEVIVKVDVDKIVIDSSFSTFNRGLEFLTGFGVGTKINLQGTFNYGSKFIVVVLDEYQKETLEKIPVDLPFTTSDFIFFNVSETIITKKDQKVYYQIHDESRTNIFSKVFGPSIFNSSLIAGGN